MPEETTLNVLSLFSGIQGGGLELGLERAGMTVVGQVEIDEYCRRVLAKHWPEVPRHDDVRTAIEWWESEPRPRVDLVCGGFPCQDISNAGRREGIGGERSGLWSAMASVVRVLRPRYVLVENVTALLARGFDVVQADLAESGYDTDWDCVPAAAVGAPHRRDRVWVVATDAECQRVRQQPGPVTGSGGASVAVADGTQGPVADAASLGRGRVADASAGRDADRADGRRTEAASGSAVGRAAGGARDLADAHGSGQLQQGGRVSESRGRARHGGEPLAHSDGLGRSGQAEHGSRGWPQPEHRSWWAAEPDVGRVAHGVPARVDRLRALGNAVVPQVAEHVGRLIVAAEHPAVTTV